MDISWLIDKVLTGKASEPETKEVEKWVTQSELNRTEFDALRLLYELPQWPKESEPDFHHGLYKIKAAIELKRRAARSRIRQRKYAIVTTVIVFLIALAYPGIQNMLSDDPTDGLSFHNEQLERAVITLEKKYKVSIHVERPELGSCRFSGTFSRHSTTEEVIQTLASAMNLKYEVLEPGVYLLSGQGCIQ